MPQSLVQVDAFTDRPFAGNPAAVCVTDGPRDAAWMQAVAVELNLSETAFLHRRGADPEDWDLRWFTPGGEVELCGHATLASAWVLWTEGHLPGEHAVRFHTASGVLGAELGPEGVTLDLPATPVSWPEPGAATAAEEALLAALGLDGRTPRPAVGSSCFDAFVVLEDLACLRALAPDMGRLAAHPTRGVIVSAPGSPRESGAAGATPDFVSRFFAPSLGVPEDPVTGSAHCALGPYWAARLGRPRLVAEQASARGGRLLVELAGERVRLTGRAVTTLRGELLA